jgi:hypothetical protein
MVRSGDYDGSLACFQAAANESRERIEQHAIICVKLRDVFARRDLTPEYF